MISRKCRIGAGLASVLVGSVLLAATAHAQNPPTAQPRTTTGDRSATTPADCQQMTGVQRQECERTLSSTPPQTDPNTVNSTTRSVPSSSNPRRTRPSPPSQAETADRARQTDQEQASKERQDSDEENEKAASESQPQDEQEQAPPDTTSEADSDSDTESDSQTPPQR